MWCSGIRSTKCRHQSPEWMILNHVNCFIQKEPKRLLDFGSCWIVFINVVWGHPDGLLQFSKGQTEQILSIGLLVRDGYETVSADRQLVCHFIIWCKRVYVFVLFRQEANKQMSFRLNETELQLSTASNEVRQQRDRSVIVCTSVYSGFVVALIVMIWRCSMIFAHSLIVQGLVL